MRYFAFFYIQDNQFHGSYLYKGMNMPNFHVIKQKIASSIKTNPWSIQLINIYEFETLQDSEDFKG